MFFAAPTVTHSSLCPSLVPNSGSPLPPARPCEVFTRNFSRYQLAESRSEIILWESFLFWPDGPFDCSSLGVYKAGDGDAQTNDSTMTKEDVGFREQKSAEITDMRVTY